MVRREEINHKEDEIAKIITSPGVFSDMIWALSDDQRQWVTDVRFASLFNFDLWEIPQRLAYKVLEAFDEKSCMLVLQKGNIEINDKLVNGILRFPHCGQEIKMAQGDGKQERINNLRAQFPLTKGQSLVKATEIVDKIKLTGDADEMFKLNFLVVMTNVFIKSTTNNFVSQAILLFDDDLDNCGKYNWAQYLITNLVIAKQRWKHTSSLFYTGPMIFLLILYVDRVVSQTNKIIERNEPAFRGWTKEKLKERELMELEPGALGSGEIVKAPTVEEIKMTQGNEAAQVQNLLENGNGEIETAQVGNGVDTEDEVNTENDNGDIGGEGVHEKRQEVNTENENGDIGGEGVLEKRQEDWWEALSMKAASVIDANVQLMEARSQYNVELVNAKSFHADNPRLVELEERIKDIFEANKNWMDSASNAEDDIVNSENEKDGNDSAEDGDEDINDLPPDDDDHLDIVSWFKSPQGILEFEKDYDDAPSFSLGISQICEEVMAEHGVGKEKGSNENKVQALEPKDPKHRSKREPKLGAAYRSPYLQRIIDIYAC